MLEEIQDRCEEIDLKTKLTTREVNVGEKEKRKRTELFIEIPCAREFKNIIISKDLKERDLEKVHQSDFEKFRFLKGFEAIYSLEKGIIECEIHTDNSFQGPRLLMRRFLRLFPEEDIIIEEEEVEDEDEGRMISRNYSFPSPSDEINIYLGDSSDEFSILSGFKRDTFFYRRNLKKFSTIRIEGLDFETHDEAKEILQKLGNSVLFQVDLITDFPIHLSLDRDIKKEMISRRRSIKDDLSFTVPKNKYDNEAISLYWYARTSRSVPLLQYLAFYQVLEFYFPQYSSKDAHQKIKNLLKDPTFDINKDKNISKILDIANLSSRGNSYGDERSQIKATINHCVDEVDLLDFLEENEERKDFFDDQKKSKSLVKQKISFNRNNHDIRRDVAERIYDLRCRIVHTKGEHETELLLPFSEEIQHLSFDIELIEFVSRKVLIASCKPLNI